jgi:signal transduction histidine kinase
VAEARGLTLHVDLPANSTTIEADREGLRTILNNLVRNALSYTPRGGQVWVRVVADGRQVRLEVQDTGVGIAREHHERIFVIFQRLHGREQFKGTGIGLAVCKKIIERHGGRLWLESKPGEGTTFYFSLPIVILPG